MLIRENSRNNTAEVFGLYWNSGKRIFLVIPYEGYEGLLAVNEKDCELIDPRLVEQFVLRKDSLNGDIFLHWAIDENDLVYDLLEHDPAAMNKLKMKIKKSN